MLAPILAYFARRHAARAIRIAEQRRAAAMAQRAARKAKHKEWRYLDGIVREATTASLRASCVGKRMEPR